MDKKPRSNKEGEVGELASDWRLIERYQSTSRQHSGNYSEDTTNIFSFNNLPAFCQLWKHTSYSKPSSLFFDHDNQKIRKVVLSEEEGLVKTVDGLLLFRDGILAKWEDPENAEGCSLIAEFKEPTKGNIDGIWTNLVFALIGGAFPHAENVNGMRMLDRLKRHRVVKFEIWLKVGLKKWKPKSEEYKRNEKMIDEIIDHFHGLFNPIVPMSVHMISTNDHFVANKSK